jgi:hypothetical protein
MNTDRKKDWKNIGRANGLAIPDAALERIAQSLDALEAGFRPLAHALPPETEPAFTFHAALAPGGKLSRDSKGVVEDAE